MKTVRFLFWLGIVIMVVGTIVNGSELSQITLIEQSFSMRANIGANILSFLSPFWQGGVLIGLAKILERLNNR